MTIEEQFFLFVLEGDEDGAEAQLEKLFLSEARTLLASLRTAERMVKMRLLELDEDSQGTPLRY